MKNAIKIFEDAINEQYENIKERCSTYETVEKEIRKLTSDLAYSGKFEIAQAVETILIKKLKKEVYDLPVKDKSHAKDD